MKVYDYIPQSEKIENYDSLRKNSARYIVISSVADEFIVPKKKVKGLFLKYIAGRYMKENLKKNPSDYYILPTNFDCGLHCTYIEKSKLNESINKFKKLDFQWVSPFYFAMEILEEKAYISGKLYINIGEYIYRVEIENKEILSYHSYLKDGYYSMDMKKVDFFKKSVIWVEEEHHEFAKQS